MLPFESNDLDKLQAFCATCAEVERSVRHLKLTEQGLRVHCTLYLSSLVEGKSPFKGSLTLDFRLQFYFMYQFSPEFYDIGD
jgi:hypothetical protein